MAADANALLIVCADRIVDGTGRPALEKGFVALRQDRIQELGTVEALSRHLPESARRLEFSGCTILPGFVDSHSHLTFSAGLAPLKDLQGETDGRLILRGAANAREALLAGVTTARDLGGRGRTTLDLRDALASGLMPGPRLFVAGRPITSPDGHCHFPLVGIEGEDLKPVGLLAERWETVTPTTWRFHLRKGVKFHSGELLDAEDVKYSMSVYTDPKGVRAVCGRPTHAP